MNLKILFFKTLFLLTRLSGSFFNYEDGLLNGDVIVIHDFSNTRFSSGQ